jgi:hypothetical protein
MKRLSLFLLFAAIAAAQCVRVDPTPIVTTASTAGPGGFPALYAVSGASVGLFTDAAMTTRATTYTSIACAATCPSTSQIVLAGTSTCTGATDFLGNFGFWVTAGTYYWGGTLPNNAAAFGPFALTLASGGGGSGFALQNSGTPIGSGLTTLNVQPDASTIVTTSVAGTTGNVKYAINTATIPNIAASQAGLATVADTGASGTAYAGCPTTTINALTNGMQVTLIPAHASAGGATTFNLCTLGAVPVLGWGTSNPASNDILVNRPVVLCYDSSFSGGAWVYTPDGNAPGGSAPAPLFNTYASRPACTSGNRGQPFNASEVSNKHWVCDGTTWQPVAFDMQVVEPTAFTWTPIMSGGTDTPTITSVGGATRLSGVRADATPTTYFFQGMLTPLSMTTPYTIEVAFTLNYEASASSMCQWGVANGNSPSSVFLGTVWQASRYTTTCASLFTSLCSGGYGSPLLAPFSLFAPVIRAKLVDDGTNRNWYVNEGGGWALQLSISNTMQFGAASYWGIGCTTYTAPEQFQFTLYHASVHH